MPPNGALPGRAGPTSGSIPVRSPAVRGTPAPPASLPMAGRLARAFSVSQTALTQVVSIFERVGNGDPVPVSMAEDTVNGLLACLDEDAHALVSLVRLKAHGDYACLHSVAVSALMACLAQHMGFDEKHRFQAALAGLLHDVGKAFVPARILAKPDRLTDEEFAIVRGHPQQGFDALDATGGIADAVKDVAQHHHERPDGRGYPHRLSGNQIAVLARMGAVCDVYDAITSNRPYKDGWDPAAAMQSMLQWSGGGQFDAGVTSAFVAVMGRYPIGSLVRLRSERLAVVNAKIGGSNSGVGVTAFYCLRSQESVSPEILEVGAPTSADAIVGIESNAKWRVHDLDSLWAGDFAQRVRAARAAAVVRSTLTIGG
jgi:HD-GYP domain-containing protein (c-di-GMP phosphodiesterase class II)